MARPKKCRKVCSLPQVQHFLPAGRKPCSVEWVTLTVDEYETIRLMDDEGFSQEECGAYMKIARTTVQQIYDRARQKIARFLVSGGALCIEGGTYQLCDGKEDFCGCGGCAKHRRPQADRLPEKED